MSSLRTLTDSPRKKRIVKRPIRFQEDEHTTRAPKVERSSKPKRINRTRQTPITKAKVVKKKAPHAPMWKVWKPPSKEDEQKWQKQLEEDVNIIKASIAQRDKQESCRLFYCGDTPLKGNPDSVLRCLVSTASSSTQTLFSESQPHGGESSRSSTDPHNSPTNTSSKLM